MPAVTRPKYFDAHAHLSFDQYDTDRADVIKQTLAAETYWIEIGTDLEQSARAIQLAESIGEGVWASVGIHPTEWSKIEDLSNELTKLAKLTNSSPRVVAIGECGLDYYRPADQTAEAKTKQKELFLAQIELAKKLKKPVVIHARPKPNTVDVYQDIFDLWQQQNYPSIQLHCYADDEDAAKKFLDHGAVLSFTGLITFNHSWNNLIKQIPVNQLLAETDAPFLAPVPHRGQRNEPLFVSLVVDRLAALRGQKVMELAPELVTNALRFFSLVVR